MTGKTKLSYLAALIAIIIPSIIQWERAILIPKKEALLPPKLPLIAKKNEQLLTTLLAHNLWDKNHAKITAHTKNKQDENDQSKSKEWYLKGIGHHHQKNKPPSAMIIIGNTTKLYYENDTLPDGTQLIKININNIVVKKEGEQQQNVHLFKGN